MLLRLRLAILFNQTNICMRMVLRPWFWKRWNDTLTLEPGFPQRKLQLTT